MRGDVSRTSHWLAHISGRLPPVSSVRAWLLAGLAFAVAVLLRFALDPIADQPLPPYITLYPAIVVAAFIGGVRLGIAAVLTSAILAWSLWLDPPSPDQMTAGRAATGLVFLFTGTLTALISGSARALLDAQTVHARQRDGAAAEAVHRIKNLLTVFQALSHAAAADTPEASEYRRRLDARLAALGRAQDLLLAHGGEDLVADDFVSATLAPFLPDERFRIDCQHQMVIPAGAVTGIAMALYELATNSLKYGALKTADGRIQLSMYLIDHMGTIEWRESGPDAHECETGDGRGTRLIRTALSSIEGGHVAYTREAASIRCKMEWPALRS